MRPSINESRERGRFRARGAGVVLFALGLLIVSSVALAAAPATKAQPAAARAGEREGISVRDEKGAGLETPTTATSQAVFAAGCFWGVEAAFRQAPGVLSTEVGYTGGHVANPTYRNVCSGKTGHAEAVRVVFDPKRTAYEDLLEVFWENHDPTTRNRQGPDVGSQYRSAIFYLDDEQKRAALASKKRLEESHAFKRPIVTEIVPASTFYRAEEYHQQYLEKRGLSQCHIPANKER